MLWNFFKVLIGILLLLFFAAVLAYGAAKGDMLKIGEMKIIQYPIEIYKDITLEFKSIKDKQINRDPQSYAKDDDYSFGAQIKYKW